MSPEQAVGLGAWATVDTAPLTGREEVGGGQTAGIESALLDMLTLQCLVDIQVEMLGNG